MSVPSETSGTDAAPPSRGGSFPTTQWSMVVHAGQETDTRARAALERLCGQYWQPLYTFVRRQGRSHHEAEDATQQFLARLLAANGLRHACPERGRFRTFLLSGLRNFLISEWRRAGAEKRGGGLAPLALEAKDVDGLGLPEPVDPGLTPEQAFDRSWARAVIDQAVLSLSAEYEAGGRGQVFRAVAPLIWAEENTDAIAARAAAAGLNVNAFRVALHRARRRLGERLRHQVAETVADPAVIDAELRHLIAAIGNCGGSA